MKNKHQATLAITHRAASQAMIKKVGLTIFMLISLCVFYKEVSAKTVNLFAEHYQQQGQVALKSLATNPDTKIYVSKDKELDNISMLEKGYDMVGSSSFTSTDVSPEQALQHGKHLQADMVLVYTSYASARKKAARIAFLEKQAAAKGQTIDTDALEQQEVYDYFASYWAKVPMPKFGVHIVKLNQVMKRDDEVLDKKELRGVRVLAVVNGSAANKAGILRGDQLVKIGDQSVNQPKDLFQAVQHYNGQTVTVKVERGKESLDLPVTIAP